MKKRIAIMMSILLCALFLSSCGDKSGAQAKDALTVTEEGTEENAQADPEEAAEPSLENDTIGEGSIGEDSIGEGSIGENSIGGDSIKEGSIDSQAALPDGVYTAEFKTDSSMFHVSEACDGKGTLTVENGKMTIHISLASKKILNLYPGLAEDAAKDGAEVLLPAEDTVTYSDGMTEEVYGFDVPVPVLEEEFDLALIGTKGVWYDHKVSVSSPELLTDNTQASVDNAQAAVLSDGVYTVEIAFEGGSGKAAISSPVTVTAAEGKVTATVQWSSPNYDYMIVGGEKYLPVNTEGNSVFEIPVSCFDEPMDVIGDTVAMSRPYEVEYRLTFYSDTIKAAE